MDRNRMRGTLALALAAAVLAVAVPVNAQVIIEEREVQRGDVGGTSIGFEAGLPLVVGLDLSHRVSPKWRVGVGFGRISGLTAIRAEARWLVLAEERGRFVPSLSAGAEQYFLDDNGEEATPVGLHASIGLDYFFLNSPISLGARVGVLHTLGSSDANDVKVFAVRNDFTTAMFNAGVRYLF